MAAAYLAYKSPSDFRYENSIRVDRFAADEEKTTADFYRMKLDVMKKVLPENRKRITGAILTYLSTSEGSKKAAQVCTFKPTLDSISLG